MACHEHRGPDTNSIENELWDTIDGHASLDASCCTADSATASGIPCLRMLAINCDEYFKPLFSLKYNQYFLRIAYQTESSAFCRVRFVYLEAIISSHCFILYLQAIRVINFAISDIIIYNKFKN